MAIWMYSTSTFRDSTWRCPLWPASLRYNNKVGSAANALEPQVWTTLNDVGCWVSQWQPTPIAIERFRLFTLKRIWTITATGNVHPQSSRAQSDGTGVRVELPDASAGTSVLGGISLSVYQHMSSEAPQAKCFLSNTYCKIAGPIDESDTIEYT